MLRFSPRILVLIAILSLACAACSGSNSAISTSTPGQATPTSAHADAIALTPTTGPSPAASYATQPPQNLSLVFVSPTHGWLGQGIGQDDGRILVTDDGGATWTQQYRGNVWPEVMAFPDAQHGWMTGCILSTGISGHCERPLLTTSDGGATWTRVTNGPQGEIVSMQPALLSATTNGGATWKLLELPSSKSPLQVQRIDAEHGWVLTKSGVLITADGGATWDAVTSPCAQSSEYGARGGPLDFVDPLHGWLGCNGAAASGMVEKAFYATDDGGRTWRAIAASAPIPPATPIASGRISLDGAIAELHFQDVARGWMVLDGRAYFFYTTNDGGRTWSAEKQTSFSGGIAHATFVDPTHGWAWGHGLILRTTDGGASWEELPTPP